jgi:photosystem II stability/assembly factor-like uncharacterized protein
MTLQIGRTLAFLAVLFLCPAHAHAGWDWLYPQPQGNHLHDIEFLTETTAIAVGDAGTIMITHDTGLTWSFVNQVNGIEGALHRIRRINNSTALVVGDDGVILKTTNAGATWTAKTSGTTDNLIDLAVVPAYAMAIGSARVVQSTNAGDTWTVLPWSDEVAQYGSFGGVSVVAPAVAYVTQGLLYWKTRDAGANWEPFLPVTIEPSLGRVEFTDEDHGVIAGRGYILTTDNAGVTWNEISLGGPLHGGVGVTEFLFRSATDLVISARMGTCGTINPYDCSTWGEARAFDGDPYFWNSEYAPQPLNGIAANGADVHLLVGDGGGMHRWVPPGGMTQAGGAEGDLLPGGSVTANGNLIVGAHAYDYFFDPGGEYSILLRSTLVPGRLKR